MTNKLLNQIVALLGQLVTNSIKNLRLTEEIHAAIISQKKGLADYAEEYLGVDASPADIAPDELGCAESVTTIISQMLPDFKIEPATWLLKEKLDADHRFERVTKAERGVIILSPTFSGNGTVVGHVGIFGNENKIMSNSSATGTWEYNFTLESWLKRYRDKGALKVYYYKMA